MKVSLFFSLATIFVSSALASEEDNALRGKRRLDVQDAIAIVKNSVRALIKDDPANAAGFVRLAFHDCVGGCNGCLCTLNPDNNGLAPFVILLDPTVNEVKDSELSRADVWALAGFTAAEVAQYKKNYIPFPLEWIGRVDVEECSTGDIAGLLEANCDEFPSPNLATPGLLEFMDETFCFGNEETTAIMGAHTLGEARPENSGFEGIGGWVPNMNKLDNQYYQQVLLSGWKQIFIDNEDPIPDRYQWIKGGNGPTDKKTFMLDSDLAIAVDFSGNLKPTGEVTCPLQGRRSCPFAGLRDLAVEYAQDNELWVRDFQKAYAKMLVTGYDTCDVEGCTAESPCVIGNENILDGENCVACN